MGGISFLRNVTLSHSHAGTLSHSHAGINVTGAMKRVAAASAADTTTLRPRRGGATPAAILSRAAGNGMPLPVERCALRVAPAAQLMIARVLRQVQISH